MAETFTEEEWQQIADRWSYIRSIAREIDSAIENQNHGQLWASLKGVSERTSDLAEGVVSRILRKAKEELHMANDDAQVIVHLLVGHSDRHRMLYFQSAYFKTALDAVVRDFLPAMVAGFAAMAEDKDQQLRAALEAQRIMDLSMSPVAIEDIQRWLSGNAPPEEPGT